MFAESPRMFKGEPARARPADGARSPPAVTGGGVGTSGHRRGQLRATCAGRPGALVGKSPGQSAVRGGDRQRGVVALPGAGGVTLCRGTEGRSEGEGSRCF